MKRFARQFDLGQRVEAAFSLAFKGLKVGRGDRGAVEAQGWPKTAAVYVAFDNGQHGWCRYDELRDASPGQPKFRGLL